jgi:hypothetical protein
MLVAGVVHDEVQHDPDAPLARLVHEHLEVAHLAEPRVHAEVVSDVVPAVTPRRRVDGVQPDRGDAQAGQVIQPGDQAPEVAYPVVVGVLEQPDVNGVEDAGPVPAGNHHRSSCLVGVRSAGQPAGRGGGPHHPVG